MDREQIPELASVVDALEEHISNVVLNTMTEYDIGFTVNLLINVSTSMLAKALVMVEEPSRPEIARIVSVMTRVKAQEGEAVVTTMELIEKAKAH